MTEPTIICPHCHTEIKLTESLAAPIIEVTRKNYEQRLAKKEADIAGREQSLRKQQEELSKAQESIDAQGFKKSSEQIVSAMIRRT